MFIARQFAGYRLFVLSLWLNLKGSFCQKKDNILTKEDVRSYQANYSQIFIFRKNLLLLTSRIFSNDELVISFLERLEDSNSGLSGKI